MSTVPESRGQPGGLAQARLTLQVGLHLLRCMWPAPPAVAATRTMPQGALLQQLWAVGNGSLVFLVLTQAFLGAIFTLQAGFQAQRILGDTSLVGPQSLPLLVRLIGPTLTGLMLATRVGTGIAAEIGSMVVTEQVDALRLCGADPIAYLLKSRLWACLVMVPLLTLVGIATAFGAGLLTAQLVFDTPPAMYARFEAVGLVDLLEGELKAILFGLAIPIIAGAAGFSAHGGSEGVGEATTRAVVNTSLAVIVLDFLVGGFVFVVAR